MSFARLYSAQLDVLSGKIVSVEVATTGGLNAFNIVGLGDRSIEEARDRVGSALKNSGYESPKHKNQKTVVSLSPADLKKEGSHYDLAIAIGYLIAEGLATHNLDHTLCIGELALDGGVAPVRGILALVTAAKAHGFTQVIVPTENAAEAALVEAITIYPARTLRQVIEHIQKETDGRPAHKVEPFEPGEESSILDIPATDFADIKGQESAKRGLIIAAAGGHNILLYGPPGSGKTLLARALCGIMPPLSRAHALEVTSIASIAEGAQPGLRTSVPFRAPHHTSSYVSVIGGGASPRPGEITRAHRGVLFLDEFPEFDRRVIESLRQPLEEHFVTIARAKGSAVFPAQFLFVAAMNPCPCGYKGSKVKQCSCTMAELVRYKRKLSGPLLDRIDMALYVGELPFEALSTARGASESAPLQATVAAARTKAFLRAREAHMPERLNGEIPGKDLHALVACSPESIKLLNEVAEKIGLSGRSYHRTQKLARTIADLAESEFILPEHILEAIRYRPQMDAF